ncbi:hypothetical protein EV424DRAFT_1352665 [Suillus variegatus]|nr:hypothetical protein EV424DRAFT_1352665 [Suillus variegatus]
MEIGYVAHQGSGVGFFHFSPRLLVNATHGRFISGLDLVVDGWVAHIIRNLSLKGLTDEESNNTDAPYCVGKDAIREHSDQVGCKSESDDQLQPKSLRKRVTIKAAIISLPTDLAQMGRLVVELVRKVIHYKQATTAGKTGMPTRQVTKGSADESGGNTVPKAGYNASGAHHTGQHICSFGPHSTRRGMEHLATPAVNDQSTKKTKATKDVLPVVNDRLPKKLLAARDRSPAVNDQLPKKTKATRSAACSPSDAPARSTRSKIDNRLGA